MDNSNSTERILALDGFRALAALGVLYIHCWSAFGNPAMKIEGINFASVLAIGGNGIDLFFAISGFILYLIYSKKRFSFTDFLKKRWRRLSPAFYSASVVYIAIAFLEDGSFSIFKSALTSTFYLNNVFPKYNSAGLLWTLSLEWQFYILFAVFILVQKRKNFWLATAIFSAIFLLIPILLTLVLRWQAEQYTDQIFFRFFEFLSGMIAAKVFSNKSNNKNINPILIVPVIIIIFFGRYFTTKTVLESSAEYSSYFKLLGFSIMGFGFSCLIYLGLQISGLSRFFKSTGLVELGKISYSFYLWHGAILLIIVPLISKIPLSDVSKVFITFFLATLVTLGAARVSFSVLEKPFLK